MTLTESQRRTLIDDLQNLDYEYESWDPNIEVWRAGEGYKRSLPYITVDFIASTDTKKFGSQGDIVGRVDDHRYEYAYCEPEMVSITIYANKYHNSGAIRGRDFAMWAIKEIKKRILSYWNELYLYSYNASIERSINFPIKDLTNAIPQVKTRVHELELNVMLRTDMRWYKKKDPDDSVEEIASKAYVELSNIEEQDKKNYMRIEFNG